ncbi:Endoplasmic reticulum metallopeptidase 1 [Papilio xuthus]|uniref:FXNA-like protease n=1 Tax=Papilio xuthus TaxID=66420 RepID=A0A194QER1_PAPXU|nr:Endoplasmic reticulum metallopeptidase 1 [Papilio xuthus]
MYSDQFDIDTLNRRRITESMTHRDLPELSPLDIDEERNEKPWQKILNQIIKNRSQSMKSVPSVAILLVVGFYLILGYLTQLIEDDMPRVITKKDVQDNDIIFSEESAKVYLDQVLGDQPRVAGMEYHYEKTKDLKLLLDTIAQQATIPVKTDWQFVSGDYFLEFKIPHVNLYRNLSNIIAVLEGESGFYKNGTIGTSLLVNCHYDSVPFAIGASDNGVFCAVMLETLNKLSKRKHKLKHNIIFLFNGAEENPLQGSHGFLKHPWVQGVTNVVNLDAAGMNGKPAVFQVSDPRLISVYQSVVPKPNAQCFGEFLFKTGLIPSDTDFRIWRDFGDIHGLSSVLDLLSSLLGRVVSAASGLLATVLLVLIMAITTKQLRYLSKPWLVVPLYWMPFFIVSFLASINYEATSRKCALNRSLHTLQAMTSTRLLLGVLLIILSIFPSLTSLRYVISVPLFVMSFGAMVSMTVVKYCRLKAWQHLIIEIILSVPCTMFIISLSLRLDAIMLPTAGRLPTKYPDYIVGGLNLILAVLFSTAVSGIELLLSRRRLWLPIVLLSSVCVVFMFTPTSVYDDLATQRHYWFHTETITYDKNGSAINYKSGILITKQDAYTLTTVLPALQHAGISVHNVTDIASDCERYVYCNMPLYRPRFAQHLRDVLFLYTDPPARFQPEPSLTATRSCSDNTCTLSCVMTGPQHNTLTFFPLYGVNLTRWSFSSPLEVTDQFQNRNIYVITEATCTYSKILAPMEFTLTFNVTKQQRTEPLVEISHHAHKIHHPEEFTEEYKKFINAMPKYFNIASTLTLQKEGEHFPDYWQDDSNYDWYSDELEKLGILSSENKDTVDENKIQNDVEAENDRKVAEEIENFRSDIEDQFNVDSADIDLVDYQIEDNRSEGEDDEIADKKESEENLDDLEDLAADVADLNRIKESLDDSKESKHEVKPLNPIKKFDADTNDIINNAKNETDEIIQETKDILKEDDGKNDFLEVIPINLDTSNLNDTLEETKKILNSTDDRLDEEVKKIVPQEDMENILKVDEDNLKNFNEAYDDMLAWSKMADSLNETDLFNETISNDEKELDEIYKAYIDLTDDYENIDDGHLDILLDNKKSEQKESFPDDTRSEEESKHKTHPIEYLNDALNASDGIKNPDAEMIPEIEVNTKTQTKDNNVVNSTIPDTDYNYVIQSEYDEVLQKFKQNHSEDFNFKSENFDKHIAPIHITLSEDPVVVTSPNYPNYYPTNNIIDWIFYGDGEGIEFNITDFAVNGHVGDYLLVKPGGVDSSHNNGLIFSYTLATKRQYLFLDVNRMFVRFEAKPGMQFMRGFSFSVKILRHSTFDNEPEPSPEPIRPLPHSMITLNLGGTNLENFNDQQVEEFRQIIADMATMYINANNIDHGLNTT